MNSRTEDCDCRHSCSGGCNVRCECNRLLARLDGDTLELSCPRCKRKALINLKELAESRSITRSLRFYQVI